MTHAHPLTTGQRVDGKSFAQLKRTMMLEHCKWDPQVGDTATLLDFPLLIEEKTWTDLATFAEQLTTETLSMERELRQRPDLHASLGISSSLRRALLRTHEAPSAVRVMRFDFHWTSEGWRVSEVNADVPGGYCEATAFTREMAALSGKRPAGFPGDELVARIEATAGGNPVALASAVGYMEDHQVVSYLSRCLRARGVRTYLVSLDTLTWEKGRATYGGDPVGVLFRFFQVEWLPKLAPLTWRSMFDACATPTVNPVHAMLIESKRLPLVWHNLQTKAAAWHSLLPEACDPRGASLQDGRPWVLKAAFCNTGDSVVISDLVSAATWRAAVRAAHRKPMHWVAQRGFTTLPVETPAGPLYPCVGIYTIDGKACGIYARASRTQVTAFDAYDVAVLLAGDHAATGAATQ